MSEKKNKNYSGRTEHKNTGEHSQHADHSAKVAARDYVIEIYI